MMILVMICVLELQALNVESFLKLRGGYGQPEGPKILPEEQHSPDAFERGKSAAEAVDPAVVAQMNIPQIQRLFAEHGAPELDDDTARSILEKAQQISPDRNEEENAIVGLHEKKESSISDDFEQQNSEKFGEVRINFHCVFLAD